MKRSTLILAVLVALTGCKKSNQVDIDNGAGGNNDQTLPACADGVGPGTQGAVMAHVGRLGGGCFWVDDTEVTRAQYAEMVAAKPSNVADCQGQNPSFDPLPAIDLTESDLPVSGVDWCDASAYCAWAGKRLCGTYTAATGDVSELESTCTDGDGGSFRYADDLSIGSGNCGGNAATPSEVKFHAKCVTPTGVYDLAGNVREWTAECEAAGCATRGGSYASTSSDDFGCKAKTTLPRASARADVGFRCCAEDAAK